MIVLAAGVLVGSLEAVRARRAELQTRRTGYVADMDLANRALNEGDLGMARRLLRRYLPAPHETDLRNWARLPSKLAAVVSGEKIRPAFNASTSSVPLSDSEGIRSRFAAFSLANAAST